LIIGQSEPPLSADCGRFLNGQPCLTLRRDNEGRRGCERAKEIDISQDEAAELIKVFERFVQAVKGLKP
jgi:hypothetical protein